MILLGYVRINQYIEKVGLKFWWGGLYDEWDLCILFLDILQDAPIYRDEKAEIRLMHVEVSHKEMEEILILKIQGIFVGGDHFAH